ncbi:hypothetical protein GNY06_04110 [Elizabethkingia argentiflava]|uniref:Uncharacterized protein n=1 Tax=Elizabethkingia argenteiflava TaxID=2681556 RepID=A0A845PUA5_9FLAO|nr:hypothetical protein [Elizabethkingia argenteiflava]NAW50601.1 hypothetical protein [Elizabethkingia argenteiflava]
MRKLTPSVKGLIFSFLAVIGAFAIYYNYLKKENQYLVDNPTPDVYYFKINDDAEKIIASGQYVNVALSTGENNIKVFDRNKKLLYDSLFTVSKVRGLLNITHQDYYINRQYYGYNIDKDSLRAQHALKVDGETLFTDAQKVNKLYTEDFYYNVNEDYDAVIKNMQKLESRTKIFRKQDFLNYYKNYYNE